MLNIVEDNMCTKINQSNNDIRHNWSLNEVQDLYNLPFNDLIAKSHNIFSKYWDVNKIQLSTLCSIKTGGCPENCAYCSQSAANNTSIKGTPLMEMDEILSQAKAAKAAGSSRFCMGAAWRNPKDKMLDKVIEIIKLVKELGLETCATLGMLTQEQADKLKEAGLDYYNHNIDTSKEYYANIITTRTFQDRLDTLEKVRKSGMKICCGGILGMGETIDDRLNMLITLSNLSEHPESVPINELIPIPGTPLANQQRLEEFDFVRIIALARIMMPKSYVRLSAGRNKMSETLQALCFFAGANSMFYGNKLLTELADNSEMNQDQALLNKLGLEIE